MANVHQFEVVVVGAGGAGLMAVCLLLLIPCYKSLRLVMKGNMGLELGLVLGISYMFLIRSFVEVDWLGPFGIGVLMFYPIFTRLAALSGREDKTAPVRSGSGLRDIPA